MMAKRLKLSSFDPVNWVLIARNAAGEKVGSMASRGDVEYASRLAYSLLRLDRSGFYATVDIYPYLNDGVVYPWQEPEPESSLVSVSLDDEV
jgi:hypothetical protein